MNTAARSGNAIVLSLGLVALAAALVVASATSSVSIIQENTRRGNQLRAMAAVEAVLQRREASVVTRANDGTLLTWTGSVSTEEPNFGVDYYGGCEVRWKIEPMRTIKGGEFSGVAATTKYASNPSPSTAYSPLDSTKEFSNGITYLYRVSAEARVPGTNATDVLAAAQGVRNLSVLNSPLFRYVIFYAAKENHKGDLEFSHGPDVTIKGNVHSNGAIYLGSGCQTNDWSAVSGPTGFTRIQSPVAGKQAKVQGMDGIFRLSKTTMYSWINGFPIINPPVGGIPAVTKDLTYSCANSKFPNEPVIPDITSVATATVNGTNINPNRVMDDSKLTANDVSERSINTINVLAGYTGSPDIGNDSRDAARSAARKWKVLSPSSTVFNGYAKSIETGALAVQVQTELAAPRPLEPQKLDYGTTPDIQENAKPVFFSSSSGATTTDPAVAKAGLSGNLVEKPGLYLAYALGGGLAMTRKLDGTGWSITNQAGNPTTITPTSNALIIRERPIPLCTLWPGTGNENNIVPANHPDYLPYSYGKHWRPTLMPGTPIDVVADIHSESDGSAWNDIGNGGNSPVSNRSLNVANRSVTYSGNGAFNMVGGIGVPVSNYDTAGINANPPPIPGLGYTRKIQYHRDNWRLLHLKKNNGLTDANILALPTGLRAYVWYNNDNGTTPGGSDARISRFVGAPTWSGIDPTPDTSQPWLPAAAPVGVTTDYYCIRWDGYVVPPTSEPYTFTVNCDDGVRVWVDDRLVLERWYYSGSDTDSLAIPLTAGKPARLVIEFFESAGGDNFTMWWKTPSAPVKALIPQAQLRAAPAIAGFDRTKMTSVVTRVPLSSLASVASVPDQKVGLMIREAVGTPDMANGRDRYVALCYNPTRGIFLERRMEPSVEKMASNQVNAWYIGAGDYTINAGASVPATAGKIPIPTPFSATIAPNTYTVTRPTATIQRTGATAVNDSLATSAGATSATSTTGTTSVSPASTVFAFSEGSATVRTGQYSKQLRRQYDWAKARTKDQSFVYTMSGASGFPPTPWATTNLPPINLFPNPSTTTTTAAYVYTFGGGAYTWNGVLQQITQAAPQSKTTSSQVSVLGPIYTSPATFANDVWIPASGSWAPFASGAAMVAKMNLINFGGRSDWQLGAGTGFSGIG